MNDAITGLSSKGRVRIMRLVTVCIVAVAWAGCGGGSSKKSTTKAASGLPKDLTLDDATAAQQRQFCNYYYKTIYTDAVNKGICAAGAIGTMQTTTACTDFVAQCLALTTSGAFADACVDSMKMDGCAASVLALEACTEALRTSIADAYGGIDCSTTADELMSALSAGVPQVCKPLYGSCPVIAGGSTQDCCSPSDSCGFANDGNCDCPDQFWEAADCTGDAGNSCCTASNDCHYENDGYCDCPDQVWDATDCFGADGGVPDAGGSTDSGASDAASVKDASPD